MHKMKASILLLLAFAQVALGGSADAIIKGKTGTGRTQLDLHVQDISGTVTYLKFTVDGKSLDISQDADGPVFESVICDKRNRVYAVSVKTSRAEFRFWMIPATLKIVYSGEGKEKWTFDAVAVGTDPRKKEKWQLSPEIDLACTLEWKI